MDYFDPIAVINSSGAVQERYAYSAFGVPLILAPDYSVRGSSAVGWDFLFHGQFTDPETAYQNYGYRFYLPALGRWLSRDPIGEIGGTNLYAFSENSAPTLYDYLGLQSPVQPGQPARPQPQSDWNAIHDEIATGGQKALEASEDELKKKQEKYDALTKEQQMQYPGRPNDSNLMEYCGRVCEHCEEGNPPKLYRTGPVRGTIDPKTGGKSCDPTTAPPCNEGDKQVGTYHNHTTSTRGTLSKSDKNIGKVGKPGRVGEPPLPENMKVPPMLPIGMTVREGGKIRTDIYNPNLGPTPFTHSSK